MSAVVVSVSIYMYSSAEEVDSFQSQFESDAFKLFEAIGTNFDLTMGAADAFMIRVVSQAKSTDAVWPMVTIPDLAVQAAKLIATTNAIYFAFYPLIAGEQRSAWENFTKDNDGWVEESLKVQARNPNFHGPILEDFPISHTIWNNEGPVPEESPGPFLPSWLGSPIIPTFAPYNWNALAYAAFAEGLVASMDTKSVTVTSVSNHADPNDPVAVSQAAMTSDWAIPYIDEDEDSSEPFADMYYPVIDTMNDVVFEPTSETESLGVVGFSFFWRHIIENILPPNSRGLILVFANTCGGQFFTYQIDGKEPMYLGVGDLHENKDSYEAMAVTRNLTDLINLQGTYTGFQMNADFCPYTITAYPSSTAESIHVTTDPIRFTVGATFIFLFTSVLFFLYDCFVNKRQRLIQERALASGAIVSSLFPDQVRDQLYEDNEAKSKASPPLRRSGQFLNNGPVSDKMDNAPITGRPNAQLYENTTVFMADLVGFTAWSAHRTPQAVFELLEAVYGEFDKLAARRRVFKVETIGDCYVAVTGIPTPQAMHSIIMVKFARDCLEKIPIITRRLAETLGQDTLELGMRVGLHSGNTTAGVLRGDKGRFQLFGDTINTAARMESNGVKGRIQVSQATADDLTMSGKKSWLVPRKEIISAKGKGDMQTYFVVVKQKGTGTSTSDSNEDMSVDDQVSEPISEQFSEPVSDRIEGRRSIPPSVNSYRGCETEVWV